MPPFFRITYSVLLTCPLSNATQPQAIYSQYVSSCDEFVFHHILTIRVCRVLYTDASKRLPLRVGVRYA
jgi:hypothetical protein